MPATCTAFQPLGVTRFNRFIDNEIGNAFLGGFIVLVILVDLSNIADTIMYGRRTICKSALDRYIIYKRISSMRGLIRLFRGCEWTQRDLSFTTQKSECPEISIKITNTSSAIHHTGRLDRQSYPLPNVKRKYSKLVIPCLIKVLLLLVEALTIFAGTTVSRSVSGHACFDPKVAFPTSTRKRDGLPLCDNYFLEARGQEKGGDVRKCLDVRSRSPPYPNAKQGISLYIDETAGVSLFNIATGKQSSSSNIIVSIELMTLGEGRQRVAFLRPDLNSSYALEFFNTLMMQLFENLQIEPVSKSSELLLHQNGAHELHISLGPETSYAKVEVELLSLLRGLDLVLNSTGPPWVLGTDGKFSQRPDIVMAIVAYNRVDHGVLIVVAVLLVILRIIVNSHYSSFDDVAYIGLKEVIKDDCLLGPMAENERGAPKEAILQKFSDGYNAHIGFRPTNDKQVVVDDFGDNKMVAERVNSLFHNCFSWRGGTDK